jgi:hypothetical protein
MPEGTGGGRGPQALAPSRSASLRYASNARRPDEQATPADGGGLLSNSPARLGQRRARHPPARPSPRGTTASARGCWGLAIVSAPKGRHLLAPIRAQWRRAAWRRPACSRRPERDRARVRELRNGRPGHAKREAQALQGCDGLHTFRHAPGPTTQRHYWRLSRAKADNRRPCFGTSPPCAGVAVGRSWSIVGPWGSHPQAACSCGRR